MSQLIIDHLATWTTAPNGIKKLRELILELAVRGLLVPQDTNDEPACELLKKIAAEKTRLISEGKIKPPKPLAKITEGEKPFGLPDSWEWVRLGTFAEIKGGKRLPNGHSFSTTETKYIYIQVTNMKNGTIVQQNLKYISHETKSEIANYIISKDNLALCEIQWVMRQYKNE
jgi:type I restriction enzyme S subunit